MQGFGRKTITMHKKTTTKTRSHKFEEIVIEDKQVDTGTSNAGNTTLTDTRMELKRAIFDHNLKKLTQPQQNYGRDISSK